MNTTTLNDFISCILLDLAEAQHNSNMYSMYLSEKYREKDILRHFPVPNTTLDKMNLSVNFVIADPSLSGSGESEAVKSSGSLASFEESLEQMHEDISSYRYYINKLSEAITQLVSERLNSESFKAGKTTEQIKKAQEIARNLNSKNFRSYVYTKMRLAYMQKKPRNPEDWKQLVLNIFDEYIAKHPDVEKELQLSAADTDAIRNSIAQKTEEVISGGSKNKASLPPPPNLNIIVDADSLGQFPAQAINTMHIHIDMVNYKWAIDVSQVPPFEELSRLDTK